MGWRRWLRPARYRLKPPWIEIDLPAGKAVLVNAVGEELPISAPNGKGKVSLRRGSPVYVVIAPLVAGEALGHVQALRAAGFWLKGVPLVNPVEKEILVALRQLELAVKNATPADRSAELRKVFSRLDELTHELPADTDRDLLHYLHKKSYEKARLFLEGRGGGNRRGQCTAA